MVSITARLPAKTNATMRSVFRANVEHDSLTLADASGTGALRFELMEHKGANGDGTSPPFTTLLVHRHRQDDTALPTNIAPHLPVVERISRYRTVFPERSRWREARPVAEPGELGEIGRVSLLVQEARMVVDAEHADPFRRLWPDLGYNALGEADVVRCDLLQEDKDGGTGTSSTFLARKVFRNAAALAAHEVSEHYVRWQEAAASLIKDGPGTIPATLLDTVAPISSPSPFRTRWATA